jgi:hypothetical protein
MLNTKKRQLLPQLTHIECLSHLEVRYPRRIESSCTSETVRPKSDKSTDELAIDVNPPAKRPSSSHHSRHRKRNTGASGARRSSAVRGLSKARNGHGRMARSDASKARQIVRTQSETLVDVWVCFEEGWPDEEGKQWRRWSSRTI